jgi:hypothetical protein
MGLKKTTRLVTCGYVNEFDRAITLNLLKCFRHFAQAATRIACAVVSVLGILFISAANAVAPIHDGIKIQQSPKAYAKAVLPMHEYKCINTLYYYESRWNYKSYNKSSGTVGIPQGKSIWLKTASPVDQVKWGISYNMNRYGSMCKALQHFKRYNWH